MQCIDNDDGDDHIWIWAERSSTRNRQKLLNQFSFKNVLPLLYLVVTDIYLYVFMYVYIKI